MHHLLADSLVKQSVSMAASFGCLICKLWEWLSAQLCMCVFTCAYSVCVCLSVHVCVRLNLCFTLTINVSLLALFPLTISHQRSVNMNIEVVIINHCYDLPEVKSKLRAIWLMFRLAW